MADKKTIVVIGGTSGIGRGTAEMYAERGDNVIISGRDLERTKKIAGEIGKGRDGSVSAIAMDLAEPEKIAGALKDIEAVDHLAIVAIERDSNSVKDYDIDRAKRLVTVKLVGYMEIIHTLFERMSEDASVVLFGGLAKERPYPGSTTVTSVNGAVTSMIRTLAVELAPIRFNAIHPGIIGDSPAWKEKTEIIKKTEERTPGGTLATTEDVVGAVDFLLTNKGVNGVNLFVDRGWVLM